jgi:hypothetical protein
MLEISPSMFTRPSAARAKSADSEPGLFGHGSAMGQGCGTRFFAANALSCVVFGAMQQHSPE